MRVALHLPASDAPVREWRISQRIAGLKVRFGDAADIVVVASESHPRANECDGVSLISPDDAAATGAVDHHAYFSEVLPTESADTRGYRVSWIGRVLPMPGAQLNEDEEPNLGTHVFNRNGPRGHGDIDFTCFEYFPYGQLFRFVGLGPTDAFGHRISGDFRALCRREPGHLLIVCLGGSAVWGTTALPRQSFPEQLGAMLSAKAAESGKRFTVLNFGVPGAVMIGAVQRLMLFGAELLPDVVIFHDGVNDLYYANTCDPWLVAQHAIVYPQNLELWSKVLHQHGAEQANTGGPTAKPTDIAPLDVLRAYLRRKREAVRFAQALGAKVISGLQPFSGSKSALSSLEAERIKEWVGVPPKYRSEFTLIEGLYDTIRRQRPAVGAEIEINFHDVFRALGSDGDHFCDMVHLDAPGENVVAREYCHAVLSLSGAEGGRARD